MERLAAADDAQASGAQLLQPAAERAEIVRHARGESIAQLSKRFDPPSGFITDIGILAHRMKCLDDERPAFGEPAVDLFEHRPEVLAEQREIRDNQTELCIEYDIFV